MDEQENDTTTKEMYVFLDFNGKLTPDSFNCNNVFLRAAKLNTPNPIIQLNDCVFKGTYDYAIGTNLFFEQTSDGKQQKYAFEKASQLGLKHIISQTKVINLKQVKVLPKAATVPDDYVEMEINLKWDYQELLEKLENGSLSFEDLTAKTQEKEVEKDKNIQEKKNNVPEVKKTVVKCEKIIEEKEQSEIIPDVILQEKYNKLKRLAMRPVKRDEIQEYIVGVEQKYQEAYEYHNLQCQVLQPSDYFRANNNFHSINENTLTDAIDVDRCVLYGLIPPRSPENPVITEHEKKILFTLDNFDNLSLAARYYVLQKHVTNLEEFVANSPKRVLNIPDDFGRTPEDTLKIYRRLMNAMKDRISFEL